MNRSDVEQRLAIYYALCERASARSVEAYYHRVVIDSRPEPRPFGQIAEPWQWQLMRPIFPAVESAAGLRKGYKGPVSFLRTLTRGSDKTSSIGRLLNWLLAFSPRHLRCAVAAGDKDQANLIVDAMQAEAKLNPWLGSRLKFGQKTVRGCGGKVDILTSDAASSFGRKDDFILCDEITHWKKRDLFDVLWSGREKVAGSVFVVLSNAGTKGSWQEEIRDKALVDPTWNVYQAPGPLASWMSPEAILRMRKMLPRGLAKRVLDNIWIDPAEDADYLTRAEIQACEDLGRELGLVYTLRAAKNAKYVIGVDYGPRRDRTVISLVHLDEKLRVLVDRLYVWQGSPEDPIKVQAVDALIEELNREFNNPDLVFDPYQMEGLAQKWELHQPVERFEARGGKSNYEMAECLRSLVANQMIAWYPGAGTLVVEGKKETLVDEMAGLVIKPTPYGYRFDHEAHFHDDRCVAIGMAALHALRMDPSAPGVPAVPIEKKAGEIDRELFRFNRQDHENDHAKRRGLWGT